MNKTLTATNARTVSETAAAAPQGIRILRSTPASVRDRGVVRLGGMSPFAARAHGVAGGRANDRG